MTRTGVDPGEIHDIDVLVSEADAEALIDAFALTNQADGGSAHFRSEYFLVPPLGEIRVEIMAGYHIFSEAAWMPVCPTTRQAIAVGSATVFVPERQDQVDLLTRLGRPKDRARLQSFR